MRVYITRTLSSIERFTKYKNMMKLYFLVQAVKIFITPVDAIVQKTRYPYLLTLRLDYTSQDPI